MRRCRSRRFLVVFFFAFISKCLAVEIEDVSDVSFPWGVDRLDQNRIIVTSKLGSVFSISLSDFSKTQEKYLFHPPGV